MEWGFVGNGGVRNAVHTRVEGAHARPQRRAHDAHGHAGAHGVLVRVDAVSEGRAAEDQAREGDVREGGVGERRGEDLGGGDGVRRLFGREGEGGDDLLGLGGVVHGDRVESKQRTRGGTAMRTGPVGRANDFRARQYA
jgi:hypothetical protein